MRKISLATVGAVLFCTLGCDGESMTTDMRNDLLAKHFSPEEIARSEARSSQATTLSIVAFVWRLGAMLLLLHPRVNSAILNLAQKLSRATDAAPKLILVGIMFLLLMFVLLAIWSLPFDYLRSHIFEHRWGLSSMDTGTWFGRWVLGRAIGTLIMVLFLGGIVLLRAKFTAYWPLFTWAIMALGGLMLVYLYPLIITPMFEKLTPVQDGPIKTRLLRIAKDAELKISGIYWNDASKRTSRTNAYFAGIGSTKRIVLYDTLKDSNTKNNADEVATIIAHEAGHWKHAHVLLGTLMWLLGLGLFCALMWFVGSRGVFYRIEQAGADAIRFATLTFVLMFFAQIVAMPFASLVSRSMERVADREALELTKDPKSYIKSFVKLAKTNISNLKPNSAVVFLTYSHPPIAERLFVAEEFAKKLKTAEDSKTVNSREAP